MHFRFIKIIYLLAITVVLFSCRGFEHIRRSSDVNYKLTKANEYYDKKDYRHANTLYAELMPIMKSTRNYESLMYRYAYTYYHLKDYIEASYYFKNFGEYFPTSKDAEECEYMSAFCLYKYAPKPGLDQTNTQKALEAMQNFASKHPDSKRLGEANQIIDASRDKMEQKQAEAAKLYYNIGAYLRSYNAAPTTYRSIMKKYPDSKHTDEYLFMIMKSYYKYAKQSVESKQEERYANALDAYRELKDGYPTSTYMPEAEKLYAEIDVNIKKLRNEHK